MDWEAGLDEYFDWYQLPENRRVQFAQMKLTGQARIYWRNLQATTERRQEPMILSWAEMKSRLRIKFVPTCYRPMILDEWQHLHQGEGSVADYIARFDDLMIRCNVDEEPTTTLARFRAGLRSEFQRELVLQEVSTLEKLTGTPSIWKYTPPTTTEDPHPGSQPRKRFGTTIWAPDLLLPFPYPQHTDKASYQPVCLSPPCPPLYLSPPRTRR